VPDIIDGGLEVQQERAAKRFPNTRSRDCCDDHVRLVALVKELIGRDDELMAVRRVAQRIDAGGGSLLLRGAAGVGKSSLLEAIREELSRQGWLVLRTSGIPSERHLAFAGLHKLLRPVIAEADRLAGAPRVALLRALGLIDGPAPGRFLVGVAVLELIAELTARRRVLMLVDDVQWVDHATSEVLGFVARRLESDPVMLLAAGGDGYREPIWDGGLPELQLGGLDTAASEALLSMSAGDLEPSARAEVLEAASGNPLALIELPKTVGGVRHDGAIPMSDRLERAFAARAAELPSRVSDLVLLAAINDSDSVAEILVAAARLHDDAGVADLDAAVSAQLIVVDGPAVHFRHPLVRTAVHRSAPAIRRQAAHAALAAVLAPTPQRSVWHRAAATSEPDEALAHQLDEVAVVAQRHDALDVAVTALRRAAELSAVPAAKGRRQLEAAELAFELGDAKLASDLVRASRRMQLDAAGWLRREWVRELVQDDVFAEAERVDALIVLAADARQRGDLDLALRFLSRAASRCWTGELATAVGERVIAATRRLELDPVDPRRLVIEAHASPFERGAAIIVALNRPGATRGADFDALHLLAQAAACVGAFSKAHTLCAIVARGYREQGRLAQLAQVLGLQAWAGIRCSRWSVASAAADECTRLARETRQTRLRADALAAQAMLAALRGQSAAALSLATEAEALASTSGGAITFALVQNARAMVATDIGQPIEAFEHLWRIYEPTDPAHQQVQACWAIGSLAEYAVESGRRDQAAGELARLEVLAARTPSTGVQASLRHARAALADPQDAEPLYLAALAPDLGDSPFNSARVQLSYGCWLRRRRRITDARAPLRSARETFERLGAEGWARRARGELRAAGEDSERRPRDRWHDLSPQETQIAQLVAEGLSNKEIGLRLYLSHRTVASHLYRMFPKLGVTSRAQLARAASGR
jgi:DNA-binding CsgD family transcriptional regulator